ncbi:MAG: cell division protein FtsQ [Silanimonas sp.]|nr:MAG: cell division protein FtsQ [Silanimonas sp.]
MSPLLRLVAWSLALGLLALPVVAVVQGWIGGERWPIRTLALQAPLRLVDEASIHRAVQPLAGGGFFAVDPDAVRAALLALPWVDTVEVRKRWPDRLEVRLTELRPHARWGENRLVSEDGRLFPVPAGFALHLPRLDAADGRVAEVLAFHRELRPLLLRAGDDVERLEQSARGGWTLTTRAGLQVELGRAEALPRLSRFVRLLPALRRDPQQRPLLRADLRYTNGFALAWGEPSRAPSST